MFIDWDALAISPALVALGAMIRREWGVWVGIATPQGRTITLGASRAPLEVPLCERFMVNAVPQHESGERRVASCARTLAGWGAQGATGASPCCHVGLAAVVVPVRDAQETILGHVYASGFVRQRDEGQALMQVRASWRAISGESPPEADLDGLPRLSSADEQALARLLETIAHELARQALTTHRVDPQALPATAREYESMIGASPPMLRLFDMIERVSRGISTALILGENGTGKELIARAVHARSHRADRPFIAVNCAAIPGELMESELFGHKRGAFSGAHRDREGLFALAHHGTFFLDEIGELELPLQGKLLRVLQEGSFLPVGDSTYRKVDVRVVCATNRDLGEMVARGEFRRDLYYRINVIALEAPPLRDRPGDMMLLIAHFLSKASRTHGLGAKTLAPETLDALRAYAWPGNVRELENELERLALLSADATVVAPHHLSARIARSADTPVSLGRLMTLTMPAAVDAVERQMILAALQQTGWNKTRAAKVLGVSRRNLIRKVVQLGLEGDDTASPQTEA